MWPWFTWAGGGCGTTDPPVGRGCGPGVPGYVVGGCGTTDPLVGNGCGPGVPGYGGWVCYY